MSRLEFRDAITERFHQKFKSRTDCVVAHENGPKVGMDTSTVPVIGYEIIYSNSEQSELSANPGTKDEGTVLVTVLVKELSGNRTAISLRDEAAVLLQRQHIAGAVLAVGKILPNSYLVKGWVGYRVAVPFWHYHY